MTIIIDITISGMAYSAVTKLPATARCVVVGGGVIGTSAAYHLARKPGWSDT